MEPKQTPDIIGNKVPPNSHEAEIAVLGSMILDGSVIPEIVEKLNPESFYNIANLEIFSAIVSMWENSIPIDIITLTDYLNNTKKLEFVGGAYYITGIIAKTPSAANAQTHALIVKEKYFRRQMLEEAGALLQNMRKGEDPFEELEMHQNRLYEIQDELVFSSVMAPREAAEICIKILKDNEAGKENGIPYGIPTLDKKTHGMHNSDFIVIGAQTSIGKTRLLTSIAHYVGMIRKIPVGIVSVEMPIEQIVFALIANDAKIDSMKFRECKAVFILKEKERLNTAFKKYAESPIYIDDSAYITTTGLLAKAKNMKKKYGIKVLMVDYLQMITPVGKFGNDAKAIGSICKMAKRIAKELKIPVIMPSQLNRKISERASTKPTLSDLRESGDIEQAADVVLFIDRPGFYQKNFDDGTPGIHSEGVYNTRIYIAKQRNGPVGHFIPLQYLSYFGVFTEEVYESYQEPYDINIVKESENYEEQKDTGMYYLNQDEEKPF